jgi:hypothetical protein
MAIVKCNTCGGQYSQVEPDGTLYFHACPPAVTTAPGVSVPYPNPRNENIVLGPQGQYVGIVAQGEGVTVVSGTPI